jgi:ribosomal protein S18 acetylase RimI-like enzyme
MSEVAIREGSGEEAAVLAACFRRMWLDVGVPEEGLHDDWCERVERFVERGRRELGLRFFFAEEGQDVVGSACAQRFAGLYPDLLRPSVRRYGYLWGVWVAGSHRRLGLGRALTERCVEALRADGCSHALLHAAPMGLPLYEQLGFTPTNEMRLTLAPAAD